jgi:hypothetical protein
MQALKQYTSLDDDNIAKFNSALSARNRLNHGFFERHNFAIQTAEGRDAMIADLESMHCELFEAWQLAGQLSDVLVDCLKGQSSQQRLAPDGTRR